MGEPGKGERGEGQTMGEPGGGRAPFLRGTTVLAVRRGEDGAMAGDGQVTLGDRMIVKHSARKIRRIYRGRVLVGFAGAVADAFTLFEKLEANLEAHRGSLRRAAVELAKEWRTDRILRRLEAMLVTLDRRELLMISGSGEVIEPDDGVAAVGSGAPYALAAARALLGHTALDAAAVAREALRIAASICVFTNEAILVERLAEEGPAGTEGLSHHPEEGEV